MYIRFFHPFMHMTLTTHSFLSSHGVSQLLCFLSSLHCRCSSCFCSVDKASSGFRSGTCLCLIRRKRRSPESWCRPSWLESPKCAASWSGETSRLYIRGGHALWLNAHRIGYFTVSWAIHRPIIHRHPAQLENQETVLSKRQGHHDYNKNEHSFFCLIMPCYCANGWAGRLLVNPADPTETDKQSTQTADKSVTLHCCTIPHMFVYLLNLNRWICQFFLNISSFCCLCFLPARKLTRIISFYTLGSK